MNAVYSFTVKDIVTSVAPKRRGLWFRDTRHGDESAASMSNIQGAHRRDRGKRSNGKYAIAAATGMM
jgi:hypothetical protein